MSMSSTSSPLFGNKLLTESVHWAPFLHKSNKGRRQNSLGPVLSVAGCVCLYHYGAQCKEALFYTDIRLKLENEGY